VEHITDETRLNVSTEVYESKDAQVNPVFTDTPVAGAERVEILQENIADAAKVPPEANTLMRMAIPCGLSTGAMSADTASWYEVLPFAFSH
jgi:hypothetical protein